MALYKLIKYFTQKKAYRILLNGKEKEKFISYFINNAPNYFLLVYVVLTVRGVQIQFNPIKTAKSI